MRSLAILSAACLLALGCAGEDEVQDPVARTGTGTGYRPCAIDADCPAGQACSQAICVTIPVGIVDTGGPPDTNLPDTVGPADTGQPIPDTTGGEDPGTPLPDVVVGEDSVQPPLDTGPPPVDTSPPLDTGPPPVDTGPVDTGPPIDTGPPPEDECPLAGTNDGCEVQEGCRVNEATGGTVCIGTTGYKPFGLVCGSHEECDIILGCHFGKCTFYCELAFGAGQCTPYGLTACADIGHPYWGACQ